METSAVVGCRCARRQIPLLGAGRRVRRAAGNNIGMAAAVRRSEGFADALLSAAAGAEVRPGGKVNAAKGE